MNTALIGYGYWGHIIEHYLVNCPYFVLKRIYAYDMKAEDNPLYANKLDDILHDASIEAVFICTPIDTHFELCKKFLLYGKHVFCEKPTVKNLAQFDELVDLSIRKGKQLYTDYIYVVSKSIKHIRHLIPEIGTVRFVQGEISQFGNFYPNDDAYEVLGVHLFSIIAFLFPDIQTEQWIINETGHISNCFRSVQLVIKDSFSVNLVCSLLGAIKNREVKIYGENGSIVFDMMSQEATLRLSKYNMQNEYIYHKCEDQSWFYDENNNLKAAIESFWTTILSGNNEENYKISRKVIELLTKIEVYKE